MKKTLSILTVFVLLLSSIGAVSADTLLSSFSNVQFQFDTDEELDALNGGANYYLYSEEKGVDGEEGCINIPTVNASRSDGLTFDQEMVTVDKKYKLSFWAKNASTEDATAYAVVMLKPSIFVVTDPGNKGYTQGETIADTQTWKDLGSRKITVTDQWTKFEASFSFDEFTAGSSSVADVISYTTGVIAIRGSGNIYIDNICIEPYYEYSQVYSTDVEGTEVLSDEVLNPDRKNFTAYTYVEKTNHTTTAVLSSGATYDGRLCINAGGYDGNKCFMGTVAANSTFGMQSNGGGFLNKIHLKPNTLIKFSIWMKAPAYTTGGADAMYINVTDGSVKTSTAQTNGIIGEEANITIHCKKYLDDMPEWNDVQLVGSYDTNGTFTEGATQITSSWRQYVGYVVIPSQSMMTLEQMTSQTYPVITVKFANAGVYMLDDASLKYVTYSDGNLLADGDFSMKSGNKAIFANNETSTVAGDGKFDTYLRVAGSQTADMNVAIANGQKYTVSYWAKAENSGAQLTANISSAGLSETYTNTNTLTTQWQKFSFDYENTSDKLSKLSFSAADFGGSFSIADVKVKEFAPVVVPDEVFTDYEISGYAAEGHTLTVSPVFKTEKTYSYLMRVYRSVNDGYIPVAEADITETQTGEYVITKADAGKKLMIEVLVYNVTEIYAVKSETDAVLPEKEIAPTFDGWNKTAGTVSATVSVVNNSASGETIKMCVFAMILDENERVLNFDQIGNISVAVGETPNFDITLSDMAEYNPERMRLYVWEGTDVFTSAMKPLISEITYNLE